MSIIELNDGVYIEGLEVRKEMRGGYMSDEVYQEVVDNTIIVCTDTIIVNINRKTIYLAKRIIRPMRGLWWIGGRRKKGETPKQGMHRNFKRETDLDLTVDRFNFVTMTEYLWPDREQSPQENGSHNLCHQFVVELNDVELQKARENLSSEEYDHEFGLKEFNYTQLLDIEELHPVILEVYNKIFP